MRCSRCGGGLPLLSRRGDPAHGRVHAGALGVSTVRTLQHPLTGSKPPTTFLVPAARVAAVSLRTFHPFPPPPRGTRAVDTHVLLLLLLLSRVKALCLEPALSDCVFFVILLLGIIRVAEYLVNEAGANVNAVNHRGDTALSLAAFWGRVRTVGRADE